MLKADPHVWEHILDCVRYIEQHPFVDDQRRIIPLALSPHQGSYAYIDLEVLIEYYVVVLDDNTVEVHLVYGSTLTC